MDLTDEIPERWWVLQPEAHFFSLCGECGRSLDLSYAVPMTQHTPLCSVCSGAKLVDTPVTAEYARWIEEGDYRWWSPWFCNCSACDAEGAMT